jgi:phosphoglycerate-specific signal transduction histidine kinase
MLNKTQSEIINRISTIWVEMPELRFTQLLLNLEIYELESVGTVGNEMTFIVDNYNQKDEETLNLIIDSKTNYDLERTKKS